MGERVNGAPTWALGILFARAWEGRPSRSLLTLTATTVCFSGGSLGNRLRKARGYSRLSRSCRSEDGSFRNELWVYPPVEMRYSDEMVQ